MAENHHDEELSAEERHRQRMRNAGVESDAVPPPKNGGKDSAGKRPKPGKTGPTGDIPSEHVPLDDAPDDVPEEGDVVVNYQGNSEQLVRGLFGKRKKPKR